MFIKAEYNIVSENSFYCRHDCELNERKKYDLFDDKIGNATLIEKKIGFLNVNN